MSRIRTIKPEFCTSEQIGECSTTVRLLFVELWMFVDDGGNIPAKHMQLKAQCFPYDNFSKGDMVGFVDQLIENGLLIEYEGDDGETYWHVTGWHHQKIDRPRFKYPKFDEHSTNVRRQIVEVSTTRSPTKGPDPTVPEGNGKERSKNGRSSRTPYPTDFEDFWKAYPPRRKEKKKKAYDCWKRLSDEQQQAALLVVDEFAQSSLGQSEYCPGPEPWLNGHRWEDDRSSWRNGSNGQSTDRHPDGGFVFNQGKLV